MKVATAKRPARRQSQDAARPVLWLSSEEVYRGKPTRVDRDAGIIYGVKVIGVESINGMPPGKTDATVKRRIYPRAVLEAARALYEGAKVNVDHPVKPGQTREVAVGFGRLVNVRVEADGLYADLEYLRSHPVADLIAEAAERMPDAFGLSPHHAISGTKRGDAYVVTEIGWVASVDLVREPATTHGLFEAFTGFANDRQQRPFVGAVVGGQPSWAGVAGGGGVPSGGTWDDDTINPFTKVANAIKRSTEEDMNDGEMMDKEKQDEDVAEQEQAERTAPAVPTVQQLYDGVQALRDSLDPSMVKDEYVAGLDEVLAKLKELGASGGESEEEESRQTATVKPGQAVVTESAQDREIRVLRLCVESGAKLTPVQRKAACALESDQEVKDFLASLKPPSASPAGKKQITARSTSPAVVTEGRAPVPKDLDEYKRLVLN